MMRRWGRSALVALALALALVGGAASARAVAPSPLLRLVHASGGAPAIDVYANGQRVTNAAQFGDVGPYVTLPAGSYNFKVLAAGAGPAGPAFLDTNADLETGKAYTLVAADRVGQMAPVFLSDTLDVAGDGQARVRLVHISPDAPPVADVAVAGGPVVARGLQFKGATGYLAVAPGTYAFEVRPAGTAQTLATTPDLALEADRTYTAFVMGQLGDNTFRAVVAQDNAASGGVGTVPATGGGGTAPPRAPAAPVALAALALAALAGVGRLRVRTARGK